MSNMSQSSSRSNGNSSVDYTNIEEQVRIRTKQEKVQGKSYIRSIEYVEYRICRI